MSRVGRQFVQSVIGQRALVDAALRLDALRRLPQARERMPGDRIVTQIPALPRRPRLSPVEAAKRVSDALDRLGIPHGRVQVTHPLGVQIWSHPQGSYRPGTGIPLMERVVVLPAGTILQVTPDPRVVERAIESPEGFGMGHYSYRASWNLRDVDQPFSVATFERRGVPTHLLRGEGFIAGSMASRLFPLHRRGEASPS